MADTARTTNPSVLHHLEGSTPPGAAAPSFEPLASAIGDDDEYRGPALREQVGPEAHLYSPNDQILFLKVEELNHLARRSSDADASKALMMELSEIRPASAVALGMKADAMIECVSHLPSGDDLDGLGLSIWHDAVHLAADAAEALHKPAIVEQESWEFRERVARWAEASVENEGWYAIGTKLTETVVATGVPEALWVRDGDERLFLSLEDLPDFNDCRWFGHPNTIKVLRQSSEANSPDPTSREDCEARATRLAEILEAYDKWQGRGDGARLSRQAITCFERSDALSDTLDHLLRRVLQCEVRTLDGLIVKGMAAGSFHTTVWGDLAWLEDMIARATPEYPARRTDYIHRDLLRLASARGLTLNQLAGERPAAEAKPSRELLESYRTFLHMELQFLNVEMGLRGDDARSFWFGQPAGSFHGNEVMAPSTRAATVLSMFGLLPRHASESHSDEQVAA